MAYAKATKTLENLKSLGGNTANLSAILIENSHSVANNTSNVTVTAALYQKTGSYAQYSAPMLYVDWWDNVSNKWVNKASLNVTSINRYDTVSATATFDVSHASDGKLKGKVRARWVYDGSGSWPVQSGTVETDETALYTIPRYFTTMSISLGTRTNETSLPISWSTSETCDYVWYSLDAGKNWTAVGSTNSTSGSFTISGLAAGTSYGVYVRCRRKDSQLTTDKNGTWSTHPYPTLTSVGNTNYTIGSGAISFTLNNPLNRSCTITMVAKGEQASKDYTTSVTTTGTSVTLTPNAIKLYETIPSKTSNTATYKCTYSTLKETSLTGVYKCNSNDCIPSIVNNLNLKYKELSESVKNILGETNNQYLIQNQSELGISFTKAEPMNAASIRSYTVLINGSAVGSGLTSEPASGVYSSRGLVTYNKNINLSLRVTDSRGYTATTNAIEVKILPWSKPSIAVAAERENNFNTTTTITFDVVSFTKLLIGETDYNLGHRTLILNYCEGSSYDESKVLGGDGIPVTFVDNKPQNVVLELNQSNNYIFKVKLSDAFDYNEAYALVNRGIPIMMVDGKQLGVGVNCFPDGKGLYVDGPGKYTGVLELLGGIRGYSYNAGDANAGYVHLLDITRPASATTDMYISFDILQRNRRGSVDITFQYTTDGTFLVSKFLKKGDINVGYVHTADINGVSNIISIYLTTPAWDYGEITNIKHPSKMKSTTITWKGTFTSTKPSGWVQGTDAVYPVGTIYVSAENVSPASLFGGTWTPLYDRFLIGAGSGYSKGATGGYKATQAHTHSIPEQTVTSTGAGGHNHKYYLPPSWSFKIGTGTKNTVTDEAGSGLSDERTTSWVDNHTHSITTPATTSGSFGGGAAASATDGNMPPYLAVYMWQKTAE